MFGHVRIWYWLYGSAAIVFLLSWVVLKRVLLWLKSLDRDQPRVGPNSRGD